MTITLKQVGPKRWYIDVSGTLPNGKPFRKRTTQDQPSRTAAREFGENIWKAKLRGEINERTPTVAEFAEPWLAARAQRGLSSAKANKHQMAHLLPRLGDIELAKLTRKDIQAAIAEMEHSGRRSKAGGKAAPRTVLHSYSILRTMLEDAVAEGIIAANPATLRARRHELPVKRDKDPLWRRTAIYTAAEVAELVHNEDIPEPERIAYALEGLAGLRYGEASALRWASVVKDAPLGRLEVFEAWDSNNGRLKEVKTGMHRSVPIHPILAAMLMAWRVDWRRCFGRAPENTELVIPVVDGKKLRIRDVTDGRANHKRALKALGFRYRRQHDLRRSFITMCRTAGAPPDLLRWITHGVPTSVIDSYTTPPWSLLCGFVSALVLPERRQLGANNNGHA